MTNGVIRAVEKLVSRGHNEHDVIHKYSLRKIDAYIAAANDNEEQDMIALLRVYHSPKDVITEVRNKYASESVPHTVKDIARLKKLARGGSRGR